MIFILFNYLIKWDEVKLMFLKWVGIWNVCVNGW